MAKRFIGAALALVVAGCAHEWAPPPHKQPIIDMHRHTPWPGDPDQAALTSIRETLRAHNVVSSVLFITGREDVAIYRSDADPRLFLSPMFPCPPLTAERKWCAVESNGPLPELAWLDQQMAQGALAGIGELVFNYAGIAPDDPLMKAYWALAARHDIPAFVHTGRGPGPGEGPRRREGCCPEYQGDYGNPELLRPILARHPKLRIVLQHTGFDYMDETLSLLKDYPNIMVDMSVLNSVAPQALHDSSLRALVDAGFANRIVLGSDDQDYGPIIERIDGAIFLTPAQRRGIYYDNAARFLRLDKSTITKDYGH
jgi:uncharacterized protein